MAVPPSPENVETYVEDGARIAAILLVWGALAAFFRYGLTELGVFGRAFAGLGRVFGYVGVLNAVLFVLYRALDYHHALAAER
ncbi:hypothetical protein [Halobacterium rubrum]|uniref:hypothetical protein n=1 Tax=Halobacterium TaxID=2239 RepID=UPI001F2CFEA9|nr:MULTISPECIES: hypothetical protein [Halobacterium]MDH5019433.1 hypothetical protein [Halobacterium rubrum]